MSAQTEHIFFTGHHLWKPWRQMMADERWLTRENAPCDVAVVFDPELHDPNAYAQGWQSPEYWQRAKELTTPYNPFADEDN